MTRKLCWRTPRSVATGRFNGAAIDDAEIANGSAPLTSCALQCFNGAAIDDAEMKPPPGTPTVITSFNGAAIDDAEMIAYVGH